MKASVIKQGRLVKSIAIYNPNLEISIVANVGKGTKLSEVELPDSDFKSKVKIHSRLTELGADITVKKPVKKTSQRK